MNAYSAILHQAFVCTAEYLDYFLKLGSKLFLIRITLKLKLKKVTLGHKHSRNMSLIGLLSGVTVKLKFKCREGPVPSISSKLYCLFSPTGHRPPLLMKVIQNNLAASFLSPIVHHTMNTPPPKIRAAQRAPSPRREGEWDTWSVNQYPVTSTRQKRRPCQARSRFCQGHSLTTFPRVASAQRSTLCSGSLWLQAF